MRIQRLKLIAATAAGSAIVASVALLAIDGADNDHQAVASGSGDSATGTMPTQPSVAPMSLPSTTTETAQAVNVVAATTMATPSASPPAMK